MNHRQHARLFLCAFILTVMAGCSSLSSQTAEPDNWGDRKPIAYETLQDNFEQPDMIYGPFMYWFWEAPLDKDLIATMAQDMTEQGINPGFAHARRGLPAEQWLSPQWFDCFDAALKKAEAAWCYMSYCDEYDWPSGRANGLIRSKYPELANCSLKYEILECAPGRTLAIPSCDFAVAARMLDKQEKIRVISSQSLQLIDLTNASAEWTAPDDGRWCVYAFTRYSPDWGVGGTTKVNYLDRRLVPAFLEITQQPYFDHFGDRMGRSVPGVFVDNEGDYGKNLAWSDDFAAEYQKKKNRDIRLWLPLLIDEDEEGLWPKARWDWFDVVSDLYNENYTHQVSEWLKARGMYYISNLWEEDLPRVAMCVGSLIRAQRGVTMPGNDALVNIALDVHDFKETQSVTEFESRRFQSEIMGVAGWQLSPVLMKQCANAAVAWGVSHIIPHGISLNRQWNTTRYPPDLYKSNPYWPYLRAWTDFCRRASYINSQGHTVPDVLLLSPLDSAWSLLGDSAFSPNTTKRKDYIKCVHGPQIQAIDDSYSSAMRQLAAQRIEYLIADDVYLRRMQIEDAQLVEGPFYFKTVIMPRMTILSYDIADKLIASAKAGVRFYVLGDLPCDSIDTGKDDPAMIEMMNVLRALPTVTVTDQSIDELVAQGAAGLHSQITFNRGAFAMLQLHRRVQGRDFFWLVNNTGQPQQCDISVAGAHGQAAIWDCETGLRHTINSHDQNQASRLNLTFAPYEAYWLVFDPELPASTDTPAPPVPAEQIRLNGPWTARINTRIQPPPPVQPAPQSHIPQELLNNKGMPVALEDWSAWGLTDFSGYVDYTINFNLKQVNREAVLSLGDVLHVVEVQVNGFDCGYRCWPPYEFKVGPALKVGSNMVRVRVGNLLSNAMMQYGENAVTGWWRPLDQRNLQSGLMGPVILRQ